MKRTVCLLALGLLAACAAPNAGEDPAQSSDSAWVSSSWKLLATCDGGAAVLDVDGNDPTNVQLVIRDRRIVEYLQSKSPTNITNAKGEIIVTSNEQVKHPLGSFADFGKDDFWRYHVDGRAHDPCARRRRGREGTRLRVVFDGREVISADDATFASGKVGLWTKADSITSFDDLEATEL